MFMLKHNSCNCSVEEQQVPAQAQRLGMSIRSAASGFLLWKRAQCNRDAVSKEPLMARHDLSWK